MPSVELDETAIAPDKASDDAARTQTRAGTAPPTPAGPLPAGLQLGHFRVEKKLGAGGMGEVYLATDLALDRPVAVKVLPASAATGDARERLVREARAQARIQHPNVAHIYFIGEDAGRLYFAMEYINGASLAERLAKGPLPVEDALALVHDAALGLREAQRAGFTHRDVKPSNLMVDAHGVVKVVDFGLAAASPGSDGHGDGPVEQTSIAGTPLYMAPEQARGEPIDLRADIYALGATLYHLVSGKPPFQADTVGELITLHASAERPAVPRGSNPRTAVTAIDRLVARMMSPSPADRFASYDELLQAIEVTSIEHTKPAGFIVRSIATALDIAFGVLLVVLARVTGFLLALAHIGVNDRAYNLDVFIFPAAILLTIVTLKRWGTTPGKALFELEVIAIDTGDRPSWRQAIIRQLALGALPMISVAISAMLGDVDVQTGAGAGSAVGSGSGSDEGVGLAIGGSGADSGLVALSVFVILAGALIHAVLRVPGKRTPWDRMSGTQVRYRTSRRKSIADRALLP